MVILAIFGASTRAAAQQETILHSFPDNATDGYYLQAGLVSDTSGNLYGTTAYGGTYGNGAVFELTLISGGAWTETILHSFNGGTDGRFPQAGLVLDSAGNLYGTTYNGGDYFDFGTVYELSPTAGGSWTETILHSFNDDGTDGINPSASLIFDAKGNLYSTTPYGGAYGAGTAFELIPAAGGAWTEKVLHSFDHNGTEGYSPYERLAFDTSGHLYGATTSGGVYGYGVVFELTPAANRAWKYLPLHEFRNNPDGYAPFALTLDAAGNVYGVTSLGGTHSHGTAFELTPKPGGGLWTEKILHNFNNNDEDGAIPEGALTLGPSGTLYGVTQTGGANYCSLTGNNCGTVFELSPRPGGVWAETILHNFSGDGTDGIWPFSGVILGASGSLYGTTIFGGAYDFEDTGGTVFEITP